MDYVVPDYIYTCATEAGVVMLDARRGKYSMVPSDRARSLEGVVRGWPALPMMATPLVKFVAGHQTAPSSSLLNSLVDGGMVMPVAVSPLRVCERAIPVAQEALLDAMAAREQPRIHGRDVVMFFRSVTYATVMLKWRPFEALLCNFRQRKGCGTTGAVTRSIAQIRERFRVFCWLRPFAYAESDACLFDSVALMDFLYRQGVLADFFIGVRIRPFVAHSWVQAQGFALNGLPEYLAAYSPILSV